MLNNSEHPVFIAKQLQNFFPEKNGQKNTENLIKKNYSEAMDRQLFSQKHVKLKSHKVYSHMHSDLNAQFLYYLSNTIWRNEGDADVPTKIFYLNKALHSFNCSYDTELPNIFLLIHCLGIVLGKANYSDYFVACQNITVGSDAGISPSLGEGLYLGPGSSVIGDSKLDSCVHLAVNAIVLNKSVQCNTLCIGSDQSQWKTMKRNLLKEVYFHL
jgi:serine O-acetyltransferase